MEISRKKFSVAAKESGVNMTALTSENFKENGFIVRFILPMDEKRTSAFAVLPFILEDTCRRLPTITEFSRYQGMLYGANIRGGVSRFSDSMVIGFSCSCIDDKYALGGEKVTCETLRLLLDCLTDPVLEETPEGMAFPQKQFELKRQELIDLIDADINDKRSYALKASARIIYRGEGAGVAVKGEKKAAQALTSREAYEAYLEMLTAARTEIFFVGTSLSEECRELINERFSALSRRSVYLPQITPSPLKESTEEVTKCMSVAQCKMVMGFKYSLADGQDKSDPKCRATVTLFNVMFGASPFSLLFKNVREKLSLCYYCSVGGDLNKQVIFADSGVEEKNIVSAREEILRQLEALKKGEFDDELFEQSKLFITVGNKGVNEIPSAVSEWYFSQFLNERVMTVEDFLCALEKVTREEITAFASTLSLDTVYVLKGCS